MCTSIGRYVYYGGTILLVIALLVISVLSLTVSVTSLKVGQGGNLVIGIGITHVNNIAY